MGPSSRARRVSASINRLPEECPDVRVPGGGAGAATPTRSPARHPLVQPDASDPVLRAAAAARRSHPAGAIARSRPLLAPATASIIASSRNWQGGARYCAEGYYAGLLHLRADADSRDKSGRTDRLA